MAIGGVYVLELVDRGPLELFLGDLARHMTPRWSRSGVYRARTCSFGALICSNCCHRAGSGGHMAPIEGPYRALGGYLRATVHQFALLVGGPYVVSQRPRSAYISEFEPGVPLGEYLVEAGGQPGGQPGGHPSGRTYSAVTFAGATTSRCNSRQAPNIRASLGVATCCWRRLSTVGDGSRPRRSCATSVAMCTDVPSQSSPKPIHLRCAHRQ